MRRKTSWLLWCCTTSHPMGWTRTILMVITHTHMYTHTHTCTHMHTHTHTQKQHYSVAYFDCVTALEAQYMYFRTSISKYQCISSCMSPAVNATSGISRFEPMEVQGYHTMMQSKSKTGIIFVFFIWGTATCLTTCSCTIDL